MIDLGAALALFGAAGLAAFVGAAYLGLNVHRGKAAAISQSWKRGHAAGRDEAIKAHQRRENLLRDYELVLRSTAGGIGKRVADTREIALAIQQHAPQLYKDVEGLAYSLSASDEFLVKLLSLYGESDQDASQIQARLGMTYPQSTYTDIFDTAGLRAPGASVSRHFAVTAEAGQVVIRSLGKQGVSGKVTLGQNALKRFFNDLAAKPRGLDGASSEAWTSAGLFRVDTPKDPNSGQLMATTLRATGGRLYLGLPDREDDVLSDLRHLKNSCMQALTAASTQEERRATLQRSRALRRDALHSKLPENGLCKRCEGDVTAKLRLTDQASACPLCGEAFDG